MKKIIQYIMMLTVSLMATSCYYDEVPPEAITPLPETVSYSTDVQPIWNQNCIGCHATGSTAPDLTAANSYTALTKNNKYVVPAVAANSILYKCLIGEGAPLMPPAGKMSDSKIELVKKWINDGALNN
jgi:mono/diheme cytochrome c family protein